MDVRAAVLRALRGVAETRGWIAGVDDAERLASGPAAEWLAAAYRVLRVAPTAHTLLCDDHWFSDGNQLYSLQTCSEFIEAVAARAPRASGRAVPLAVAAGAVDCSTLFSVLPLPSKVTAESLFAALQSNTSTLEAWNLDGDTVPIEVLDTRDANVLCNLAINHALFTTKGGEVLRPENRKGRDVIEYGNVLFRHSNVEDVVASAAT